MDRSIVRRLSVVFILIFLGDSSASGTTARPVELEELCRHAHQIVLGDVVSAASDTLVAGRRRFPVTTYRIRVVDTLKGTLDEKPGGREVEIRLPATPEVRPPGPGIVTYIPGVPRLEIGKRYLLLMARPNRLGFSLTVGLGHGCFRVNGSGESAAALNAFDNAGLLGAGIAHPGRGPVPYSRLAGRIREIVGKEAGK